MKRKSSIKVQVKNMCQKLGIDKDVARYFAEAVDYCIFNNIAYVDLVLTEHFYPICAKKFKKTECAIKSECIDNLKHVWKNTPIEKSIEVLGYNKKLTVKKLMCLLLDKIKM